MRKNILLLPISVATLTIAGLNLLSLEAHAARIYFEQSGTQLDRDTILDIEIGKNKTLVFDIFADVTGYTPSNPNTAFLQFDITEFIDTEEYFGAFSSGLLVFDLEGSNQQKIGTFNGITINPGIKPHDGTADFGITLDAVNLFDSNSNFLGTDSASAFDAPSFGITGGSGTEFNQVIEVQDTPEPLTTLGTFLALGLGTAFKKKKANSAT